MASFFVKAAGGTGLGTSDGTAWSYAKFLTMLGTFAAGDIIQFKRGDTFTGAFTVATSGASGNPITFTAYGTGAKPVISGLATVSSWSATSGRAGVYEATITAASSLNNVIIDGIPRHIGRWPNAGTSNDGWLVFESFVGDTSITDSTLTGTPNWTGAELVMRKRISVIDRHIITNHSTTTITYNGSNKSETPLNNEYGYGYFIQNHIDTLDSLYDWYYDSATSKLYVHFGGGVPGSYVVQVSTVTDLITCANKSYITFDNLNIKGANRDGFHISGGSNISIPNCHIELNGGDGVYIPDHASPSFVNTTFDYNTNNGFWLGFGGTTNGTFTDLTLNHSGLLTGMAPNGYGTQFGIFGFGNGHTYTNIKIYNSGYTGLYIAGNNVTVNGFLADTFCIIKNDGGGFYTYAENPGAVFSGMQVSNIITVNGISNLYGVPAGTHPFAMGIYLDGFANGMTINNATVANCEGVGLFTNTISNCVLTGITSFGNHEQIRITEFNFSAVVEDNTITGGKYISKTADQLVAVFNSVTNDHDSFGTIDNNYYVRPFDDNLTIRKALIDVNGVDLIYSVHDLARWQAQSVHDDNSGKSPTVIPEYTINSVIGSNKFANGTFPSGLGNFFSYAFASNVTVEWKESMLEGSAKTTFTAPPADDPNYTILYQSIGAITDGVSYKINFDLKGSNNNISLAVYLRDSSAPYGRCSNVKYVPITTSVVGEEVIITATETLADAHLVFEVYNQNVSFGVKNIEMFQASVTFTDPDDYFLFDYNENATDKVVPLGADTWKDAAGVEYTGSVVLEQWQSIVLIKNPVITLDKTKKLADTASQAAMLALSAPLGQGSWTVRTDLENTVFRLTGTVPGQISSWSEV